MDFFNIRSILTNIFLFLLVGCASTIQKKDITSLSLNNGNEIISEEESKLFNRSNKLHKKFISQGLIVRNKQYNHYISNIGEKVSPNFFHSKIKIKFYIFKDPSINAFALPNGNIYLNAGLLAQLQNEAQLAYVMSHEVAHVIKRHGLLSLVDRKNTMVTSHVLDLMTFGTGLVYLGTITELSSHNRKQEKEADHIGLEYFSNAGYSLNHSIDSFKRLESSKYPKEGYSIWSSHPDINKRIQATEIQIKLLQKNNTQSLVEELEVNASYEALRAEMALVSVKTRIRYKQFELAEEIIQQELEYSPESSLLVYYLGEINRLKLMEPDAHLREYAWINDLSKNKKLAAFLENNKPQYKMHADELFNKAADLDPELNIVNRGKGLLALELKQIEKAKAHFLNYLSGANVKDKKYIQSIIKEL